VPITTKVGSSSPVHGLHHLQNSIDHSVIWKTFGTDVLGFYVATAAVLVAIGSTAYALYILLIPPQ
jgi:hypothetical protein